MRRLLIESLERWIKRRRQRTLNKETRKRDAYYKKYKRKALDLDSLLKEYIEENKQKRDGRDGTDEK